MSDGMGRELAYLSSHATNRYFIPNWGIKMFFSDDKNLRSRAKRLISKTIFLTTLQEHLERTGSQDMADNAYDEFDVKDFSAEEKLRILRDYVSCMTDKFALNHYRKLSGQQIY